MFWLYSLVAFGTPPETPDIQLIPTEPVPGIVLRQPTQQIEDPLGYKLESVEIVGYGKVLSGGPQYQQVRHADEQVSLIDEGRVAHLVGQAEGYRFFLTDGHGRSLWLGAQNNETTLATWIPSMHGADLIVFSEVEMPGAEVVVGVRTYRQACPGATGWTILAITDGHFSEIASSFSTGEGGWYKREDIYLPTRQADGRLVYTSPDGRSSLSEKAVPGGVLTRREAGEPVEEGSYESKITNSSETLFVWHP
ncbi:MAG: hypothetical protein AAFV53_16425 [Myxococcota bacterium]